MILLVLGKLYMCDDHLNEELIKVTSERIADAIIATREGKVKIKPGYDGVYG